MRTAPGTAPIGHDLQHRRRYLARVQDNATGLNGNGWIVLSIPTLLLDPVTIDGEPQSLTLIGTEYETARFEYRDAKYVPLFDPELRLTRSETEYSVAFPNGNRCTFHGPSADARLAGRVKRWTDSMGRVTTAAYDAGMRLVTLEQFDLASSDVVALRYQYGEASAAAGRIVEVAKESHVAGTTRADWRVAFTYYDTGERFGSAGDLKTGAVISGSSSDEPGAERVSYYRYYKGYCLNGFPHGLELEVGPEVSAVLRERGIRYEEATEEELLEAGARRFEYDVQRRITRVQAGAHQETSYLHTLSDGAAERNWSRRSVALDAGGRRTTTYFNERNQVVLQSNSDGVASEVTVRTYDADGYLLSNFTAPNARVTEPLPWENFAVDTRGARQETPRSRPHRRAHSPSYAATNG